MVAENTIGRRESGGIDLLQLAAAAKESLHTAAPEALPPQNIIVDTNSKHKKRNQKKTLLKRKDGPPTNKQEHVHVQPKPKTNSKVTVIAKPAIHESTSHVPEPKGGQSVLILKRDDVKVKSTNKPKKNDANKHQKKADHTVIQQQHNQSKLQQELSEVKKRLEQEKTARKSSEMHCQKLQSELNSAKQTLEHETQFRKNCQRDMGQLKDELEYERAIRVKAQVDESNFNTMISEEKDRVNELREQLQHEQQSKEAILKELEETKLQLETTKSTERSIRDELAAAQQTNECLQQKMGIDSASAISIKMELHSMKSRMGRVEEVENALKQEILKVDRLQNELAKADDVKTELDEAKEKLLRIDNLKMELLLEKSKVQELETKLDDQTWLRKRNGSIPLDDDINARGKRSESISSSKYNDLDDVDIHAFEKLRKELHDTREALKAERKKNAALTSKKTKAEASSLKDWIDLALPSTAEVKLPPATQISLSDGPARPETKKTEIPDHDESGLHYFDGTKNEFCGDEDSSPLEDELTFIMSAYSSDEVIVSENRDKVTYLIDLSTNDNDDVQIKVIVHIPKGYPMEGMLGVDIGISDDSNCSTDMRKCLMDTIPKLTQMCLWEAEGNYGKEALFSVLNMADRWSKTEWPGILSKQFPSFKILQRPKTADTKQGGEAYAALIYTHHLIEPEKLQLVKKITSKLSLGGFIKSGKPGVILLTSINESDCDTILNELRSQASQKILRSTAFKLGGKVPKQTLLDIATTKITLLDNSKDGMDELVQACQSAGLADILNEII